MDRERILYIQEYLSHNTDEENYVTLKDIRAYLIDTCGVERVSTLTIYRDIEGLRASGYQIDMKIGAHNTHYYSMKRGNFTFNEIRYLVDSVSTNKFLTADQKQHLIRKFEGLCSESEVRRLISRIHISEVTPPSLNLLENLEKIHLILSKHQKIDFSYGKYNTQKQIIYYQKRRKLIPCQVVYSGERFYLIGQDAETHGRRVYRIDRMRDIVGGETFDEIPQFSEPEGAVVDIFEPDCYEVVRLRVDRVLLDDMLEQLGQYAAVMPCPQNDNSVIVRARMGIGFGFYRWILKYGSAVEVLSPESVRWVVRDKLEEMLALYQNPLQ